MPEAVAQRYARAFAEALGPSVNFERAGEDLAAFAGVYAESAELREVFDSPAVRLEQKLGVLNAILARLETSPVAANFLRVLLTHYRIPLLGEIRSAFQTIVNGVLGVEEMRVVSATALTDGEREALAARFHDLTQKTVQIDYAVDPGLVGGVVAQIRSVIYDGSVRGSLERIRELLG